jgi:hypothetical protein
MLENRKKIYKVLEKDGRTKQFKDENAFIQRYFRDETSVSEIWDYLKKNKHLTGNRKGKVYVDYDLKKFYVKYCCDLEWAKKTKYCSGSSAKNQTDNISVTQQQQNLVNKGYFIGTSGPNKNGVDGVFGKKTKEAQHALDSGIDSTSYNNIYKQQNPDLVQTIENMFGKQVPKEISDNPKPQPEDDSNNKKVQPKDDSDNKKVQVQKARVIKTIHPKNW